MQTNLSPWQISCLFLPSNDTQAVFLASRDSIIWDKTANGQISVCVMEPNIGLRPIKQLWFNERNAEKEALGGL